jgi:hypothetical protein
MGSTSAQQRDSMKIIIDMMIKNDFLSDGIVIFSFIDQRPVWVWIMKRNNSFARRMLRYDFGGFCVPVSLLVEMAPRRAEGKFKTRKDR